MNLAAILGSFLLFLASATAETPSETPDLAQQEAPTAQSSGNSSANPSTQTTEQGKPRKRKKTAPPDCTNAPSPLNAQPGSSSASTNEGENSGKTSPPANTESDSQKQASSMDAEPAKSAANKPCPPAKKVVNNGGSKEPAIKLTGDTAAGEAAEQRSTEQLTSTAEANLKKISERDLQPNQKATVKQIHEFLQQSKAATAAGNPELAHNLAQKAQLLSDELANAK